MSDFDLKDGEEDIFIEKDDTVVPEAREEIYTWFQPWEKKHLH